jgi:hypothetical protein
MTDYIKTIYAQIKIKFRNSNLDKKEVLKRYLRRYKCIDISDECINSRIK